MKSFCLFVVIAYHRTAIWCCDACLYYHVQALRFALWRHGDASLKGLGWREIVYFMIVAKLQADYSKGLEPSGEHLESMRNLEKRLNRRPHVFQ